MRRRPPLCSRWRDERLARMHRRVGRAAAGTVARLTRAHREQSPALLSAGEGGGGGTVESDS